MYKYDIQIKIIILLLSLSNLHWRRVGISGKMAEALITALKPAKFSVSKKGDPDVLLSEFNDYVKTFERFTKACKLDADHVCQKVASSPYVQDIKIDTANSW